MGGEEDLIGKKLNRFTVIGPKQNKKILCVCDCGTEKFVNIVYLKNNRTRSCGCLQKERVVQSNQERAVHGCSRRGKRTKEYRIWKSIRGRVYNVNSQDYNNYGARGIGMCERWDSFEHFLEDMKECPKGYSIDRIDNDGDYRPENCRWSTIVQQANNRRNNVRFNHNGHSYTMMEYCKENKLKYHRFKYLYRRKNLSVERATELTNNEIERCSGGR